MSHHAFGATIESISAHNMPIQEQIDAISGHMIAAQEQTCWLVCKLTSQSMHKDLHLRNVKLALNPEFEEFIEIVDSIGCN